MKKILSILFLLILIVSCGAQEYFDGLPKGLTVRLDSVVPGDFYCNVKLFGAVTRKGLSDITERGFVVSENINPTISDLKIVDDTTIVGNYYFEGELPNIEELSPGTTHYARAFATDNDGTKYSEQIMFTTQAEPVATATVSNITTSAVTISGEVTLNGNAVEQVRIEYDDPNGGYDHVIVDIDENNGYSVRITGLLSDQNYWYRTLPIVGNCWITYPDNQFFYTEYENTVPVVNTHGTLDFTSTTANISATLVDDGGLAITDQWFRYGLNNPPTANVISGLSGTTFVASLNNLPSNTTIYIQGGATNSAGDGYGDVESFTTLPNEGDPVVTTYRPEDVTSDGSAYLSGEVTDNGGDPNVVRGIVMNTTGTPTINDTKFALGTGEGFFGTTVNNLVQGETYYIRAYAGEGEHLVYGQEQEATIPNIMLLPTVTTVPVTNIGTTTATGGGNVTNNGGADVTARGVCYSTSQNPTLVNSHTTDGTGEGSFISNLIGLPSNTLIYARAYATNSAGTGYGEQVSFTTLSTITLPTVTTADIINIYANSATGGGEVTNNGGAEVTAHGVVYCTSANPTLADNYTSDGTGTGIFSSGLNNLTANTQYYVRAYATNSQGTSYGPQVTFTTSGLTTSIATYSVAGNYTWTVPAGTVKIDVTVIGAGGGGGSSAHDIGGGGGGGGASATLEDMTVTPGTNYSLVVGAGGLGTTNTTIGSSGESSWFMSQVVLLARGGLLGEKDETADGPDENSGGGGGSASLSIGPIKYSGGDGGDGMGNETQSCGGEGGNPATSTGAGSDGQDFLYCVMGHGSDGTNGKGGDGGREKEAEAISKGGKGGDGKVIITYYR